MKNVLSMQNIRSHSLRLLRVQHILFLVFLFFSVSSISSDLNSSSSSGHIYSKRSDKDIALAGQQVVALNNSVISVQYELMRRYPNFFQLLANFYETKLCVSSQDCDVQVEDRRKLLEELHRDINLIRISKEIVGDEIETYIKLIDAHIKNSSSGFDRQKLFDVYNFGVELTEKYPVGHAYHVSGLDLQKVYLIAYGSQEKRENLAERLINEINIKARGYVYHSGHEGDGFCFAYDQAFRAANMLLTLADTNVKTFSEMSDKVGTVLIKSGCLEFDKSAYLSAASVYADILEGSGNFESALKFRVLLLKHIPATNEMKIMVEKNRISLLNRMTGHYIEALAAVKESIEIAEKIEADSWKDDLLTTQAIIWIDMGNHVNAEEYLSSELIKIFDSPSLSYGWEYKVCNLLELLSRVHEQRNDIDSAIGVLKLCLVQGQRVIEEDKKYIAGTNLKNPFTTSVINKMARLLSSQGRLSEAQQVLDMLAEDEQFDFIRRSGDADPRRTRIGLTPSERRWNDRYQQISARLSALGSERRELENLAQQGFNPEQKSRKEQLDADFKVAQAAFTEFLNGMREELSSRGAARAVEVSETSEQVNRELQSLVRSLGEDVALLRYFITEDQVGMLLTLPSGIPVARSTRIGSKELNRQVSALNRALRDSKSQPKERLQALYKILFFPIEQDLEQAGIKTVMLAPDGVLRYMPFGALHDGKQYASERWRLPLYTSVVRDKLRDHNSPSWQAVAMGVTRKLQDFDALPAVRSELNSIVITNTSAGILNGEVYLDDAFTAQRLRQAGQRKFELLHVASHFSFSPGTEMNSFLLLGDGAHLSLGDLRTQNYRFDNVDLLTLSACETGLGGGRDEKGVEISGFAVIAQQQGAKAVLATLWKVADKSTATLMADFYRRRQTQGLTKAEALRQAQLALMQQSEYAHPFYWAPFILMGNWK